MSVYPYDIILALKEMKQRCKATLNIIASLVLVGIIYWVKKAKKENVNDSSQRENQEEAFDKSDNSRRKWWWFFYWPFFIVIFTIIMIGAILYLPTLYPKVNSDNVISAGNFQATVSENQSINGTFQIQYTDNESQTSNADNVFNLAIISSLLGGFALTMMVAQKSYYPKFLHASLLLQGVFYVLATVAFIVFGFYLAADRTRMLENLQQLVPVYTTSFYVGIISFGFSISLTIWSLIRLISKNWKRFWNLVMQAIEGE